MSARWLVGWHAIRVELGEIIGEHISERTAVRWWRELALPVEHFRGRPRTRATKLEAWVEERQRLDTGRRMAAGVRPCLRVAVRGSRRP